MKQSKILNIFISLLFLCSLVGGKNSAAWAQSPGQTGGNEPGKPERVNQVEREAAAQRATDQGFALEEAGSAEMDMGEAPRYFSHPNYANSPLPSNPVIEWNAIAQEILQPAPMPGMPMAMSEISMSAAFVYMSYVQAAVYDALVAIEGGYQPYAYSVVPNPDANRKAAVATAAYSILSHYLPDKAPMAAYQGEMASIAESPQKQAGIAIGQAAAAQTIALRDGDGLLDMADTYTVLPAGAGIWEPTVLPDSTVVMPVDPWMASLKPFLRASPEQYRPAPPPALDDPNYLADLAEVRDWGGAVSTLRTPEQTEVANFWATNMVIQSNASYRQIAESRELNLLDTARLMVTGNMIAVDSLIATFDSKYTYSFWRPITAIRHTNPDSSYSPDLLNSWMPLLMTPSFPEYVAGHGSFVSSQAELYTLFFGTDEIDVDLTSMATGTTRHFDTAEEMRTEIINARTWGGLHFRRSSELAVALGQELAMDALMGHKVWMPVISAESTTQAAAGETSIALDQADSVRPLLGAPNTRRFLVNPITDTGQHAQVAGGIRKFVNELPGLGAAGANNLGQYIPVAVPDTTTYPGSDYYEIAVVEFVEKMHADLPPTRLRGYIQLSTGVVPGAQFPLVSPEGLPILLPDGAQAVTVDPPHYLGPMIVATKDRPVRILFRNLLPTGAGGDLFIPVDTTVMGSGMGPLADMTAEMDPQNPMCGMEPKPAECYTENRAVLHLHGGISPWISDGTPHQWITPANDDTPYPQGVSVRPVPDMADTGDPNDGMMTYYYTNQQSSRLMFYHDHSYGITRLNVYAGEVAPYLIQDPTEQALVNQGLIPAADSTIALVVQDKTFVPGPIQLAVEDETWDVNRWSGPGGLWLPHVYSPAQSAGDPSGVNQFGRWAYGPWFWPPTIGVDHGPIPNPYYNEDCDEDEQWCEPEMMPGTPFNSMGMEAFMDTPIVNGTVYPTLTIDPKTYRFRILNGANDRFFNLSLYKAVDAEGNLCDLSTNPNPVPESTGVSCTEVLLNPDEVADALEDPTIFPTPLAGTEGPSWIAIGTEGGFLPAPAVIPAHPTTWVNDPTVFNAGNVDLHSLLTAPAERHDVIVDFSQYAGQTLILYNDAPAAFPARDPRYDYYTGNGDYRDTGGTPPTLPGYGPNIRTMMQIVVKPATPAPAYNLAALQTAFKATSLGGLGVFQNGQHPIIVGQREYNQAYGTAFKSSDGLVQIYNTSLTFKTILNSSLTMPLQPKMIQDEMGEAFEQEYGRMSGNLGVESPNPQAGQQNMILYSYMSPPTEVIAGLELPPGVELAPIATTDDGTQIWKITHNGVDTHPIHFHLYDVQLINRVGWDGIIRKPEPNELGWKDTVRVSPLEDTIVALRPLVPDLPWDLPNSIRLLDPTMPDGALIASSTLANAEGLLPIAFDPNGEPIDIYNHYINFGWEYVWHCHILSHEEMDMMRPQVVGIKPEIPTNLIAERTGAGADRQVTLTWTDNAINETGFTVERAVASDGPWESIALLPADTVTYIDPIGDTETLFFYRVQANNLVGDSWDYTDPAINDGAGFPTLTINSEYSNTGTFNAP